MVDTEYLAKSNDFMYASHETPLKKTIRGIIHLSEERQLFTLEQTSDPELIKGIAEKTSYIEVQKAALAHKNYPQVKISDTKKDAKRKSM